MSTTPKETSGTAGSVVPIQLLKVAAIVPDPKNRKDHDKAELATLAASIERDGLLQPVVVRELSPGKYQLIAGERRWEAHRLLKRAEIQARVMPTGADATSVEQIEQVRRVRIRQRAAENFHRVDLSPIERAKVLQELFDAKMSQREIAEFVGVKDQSTVSNLCRILRLPADVQALVHKGELSAAHAKALLRWEKWPQVCSIIARHAVAEDTQAKVLENDRLPFAAQLLKAKAIAEFSTWEYQENHYEITPEMKNDPAYVLDHYRSFCLDPEQWAKEAARQAPLIAERKRKAAQAQAARDTKTMTGKFAARAAAARKAEIARNKKRREEVRAKYQTAIKRLSAMAAPDSLSLALLASEAVSGGYVASRISDVARALGLALPKGVVPTNGANGLRNTKAMATMKPADVAKLAVGVILHKQADDACKYSRGYSPIALEAFVKKGGAK